MSRLQALMVMYEKHGIREIFDDLTSDEFDMVAEFVKDNSVLSTEEYSRRVVHWLADERKPVNFSAMLRIVILLR